CNLVEQAVPLYGGAIWAAGIVFGVLASFMVGRRMRAGGGDHRAALRWAASVVAIFAGMTALLWILNPADPMQINAAFSLMVATAYALLGIWRGGRFLLLGFVIALAVVAAWARFHDFFPLVMGIIGGGSLILGGWWLREEK
ncbi:MAG: hypothetical protein D6757_09655, partial [Alphaproteobacteria bacterium]